MKRILLATVALIGLSGVAMATKSQILSFPVGKKDILNLWIKIRSQNYDFHLTPAPYRVMLFG